MHGGSTRPIACPGYSILDWKEHSLPFRMLSTSIAYSPFPTQQPAGSLPQFPQTNLLIVMFIQHLGRR